MNLYECSYKDEEWICYVFAESRGKAKQLFHKFFGLDGSLFVDIRCKFVGKSDAVKTPTVVDNEAHEAYPVVLELGVGYTEMDSSDDQCS